MSSCNKYNTFARRSYGARSGETNTPKRIRVLFDKEGIAMKKIGLSRTVILMMAFIAIPAASQEVTLKAVSAFQEGGDVSRHFERFIAKVNAEGKGFVRINFIGGPRAMPPFEVGKAVKTG